MVIKVPPDEPYVIWRTEPGEQFEPRAKLVLNDFLYADTSQSAYGVRFARRAGRMCIACIVWIARPGIMCMDIQPGGFIRILSRVCHVIGIGDI